MLNNLAARLGLKLFMLLTAIIIFSIFPLAYMAAMQTIESFAEEIADINGIEIQSQAF